MQRREPDRAIIIHVTGNLQELVKVATLCRDCTIDRRAARRREFGDSLRRGITRGGLDIESLDIEKCLRYLYSSIYIV
jgi:hypothetical protein